MTPLVKRGTARRLGLRPWTAARQVPISYVQTPDGQQYRLVCGGSTARTFFVNERGSAAHDVPVALNVHPGSVTWGSGVWSETGRTVHIGETRHLATTCTGSRCGVGMTTPARCPVCSKPVESTVLAINAPDTYRHTDGTECAMFSRLPVTLAIEHALAPYLPAVPITVEAL